MREKTVLDFAREYLAAGLSVIPVRPDGSKAPSVGTWKKYQGELPTEADLVQWFGAGRNGIAIICGAVSGGLEVMDFDTPEAFGAWKKLMEKSRPGLVDKLPRVQTPGGVHVFYRTRSGQGNKKLAKAGKQKTVIETRGEGGYVLAPGCPPECHPDHKPYLHAGGPPLTAAPFIEELPL